jgi:predicted ATPase
VERTGERLWEAELHRLQGELYLWQTPTQPERAAWAFASARTIARRQQARSLELRATISLCRLWQCQGKRTAASALLAPIYGWFTEGFGTADLEDAKALLEELGG